MKDLLATYYFRPKEGVDAAYAANAIREEQTTGTWTDLSTVNEETAYEDSCRIEHCISEESFERLKEFLDKKG